MARNTTRQGAGFELEVMHYLAGCPCEETYERPRHVGWKGFGYDVLRSSGSHGLIDVWALGPVRHLQTPLGPIQGQSRTLFIQCKITNPVIPPAERTALLGLALRGGALPIVAHKAKDEHTGRVRPHFRVLNGPGPKEWSPWDPREETR